jgi:transcriptional regulator with XRE-family HTH domain
MGQATRPLTPHASGWHFLGAELRCWRQRRGLSLAQLARVVHTSPDLLAKIEKADRRPSPDTVRRCDDVLDTGGVLSRLLGFIERQAAIQTQDPLMTPIVIRVIAEVVAAERPETRTATSMPSDARLYVLPGGRGR